MNNSKETNDDYYIIIAKNVRYRKAGTLTGKCCLLSCFFVLLVLVI